MLTEELKKELISSVESYIEEFELRYDIALERMDRRHILGVRQNDPSLWDEIEYAGNDWASDYVTDHPEEDLQEEDIQSEVSEYLNEYFN